MALQKKVNKLQFWDLINEEPGMIKSSYADQTEIYDLAIFTWESTITPKYFKDFHHLSTYVAMYKTQADVAMKRAISSVLKKEYAQAIYNIRYAVENLGIAIFAYAEPNELTELIKPKGSPDEKVKKAANKFLESKLPDRSKRFKDLHKMCDVYGSHQSLSHHSSHFKLNEPENNFSISFVGEDNLAMNVGLIGIIIGSIVEFDMAIQALPEIDWIKVNPSTRNDIKKISQGLDEMKRKYLYLFTDLIIKELAQD